MVSLLLVLSQVTQNYCSRTNLRECFRIATGKGEAAEGWGGESSEEPAMDAEACRECRGARAGRVAVRMSSCVSCMQLCIAAFYISAIFLYSLSVRDACLACEGSPLGSGSGSGSGCNELCHLS